MKPRCRRRAGAGVSRLITGEFIGGFTGEFMVVKNDEFRGDSYMIDGC